MQELFWRFGGRCTYCDCDTVIFAEPFGKRPDNAATLDHIVPRADGGQRSEKNSALACFVCNNKKGDLSKEVFVDLVARDASPHEWRLARRAASGALNRGRRKDRRRALKPWNAVSAGRQSGPQAVVVASASPPTGDIALSGFNGIEQLFILKTLMEKEQWQAQPHNSTANSADVATTATDGAMSTATPARTRWRPSRIVSALTASITRFLPVRRASTGGHTRQGLTS